MLRRWGWETLVFRGATAVALVHALDDAFLNRQPGVGLGQHALAACVSLAAGLAAIVWFPRLRPGFRAAVAIVFGVLAVVNGGLHVAHIAVNELGGSDVTGVLAVAAGAALVLLGLAIPFRHRGEGAATPRRRWANRVVAVVVGGLLLYAFLFPAAGAIVQVHKHREAIGDPPGAEYRPVEFRASDGLLLSGWYVPSENRAAVIVVHGGGGDRTGAVGHAELLSRHGYGVLVYDSRGRGESEGTPVSFGWGWEQDVAGALRFLQEQPDVDPERIGGLGLSTGADVLFEVAAEDRDLKAVVADGATVEGFADYRNLEGLDEGAPFYWTLYTTARVLSGVSPGEPLRDLVARIAPTPLLLVATGRDLPAELDANRLYAEAAGEPSELWELPDVNHTAALRERPEEYERRVVGFFDDALSAGAGR
ncbi:MAG TPA: CocE/NonD family hydrolase [Gaiellaceae bacterium]|nr:CocE/NonD family hydrolase [Gaiellaceae bacterium]